MACVPTVGLPPGDPRSSAHLPGQQHRLNSVLRLQDPQYLTKKIPVSAVHRCAHTQTRRCAWFHWSLMVYAEVFWETSDDLICGVIGWFQTGR